MRETISLAVFVVSQNRKREQGTCMVSGPGLGEFQVYLALWGRDWPSSTFPAFSGPVGMVRWGPGALLRAPAVSLGESAV